MLLSQQLSVAIHLDTAPLASQLALQIVSIRLLADQLGHPRILFVLLLVAPAVEVEIHQPQLPFAVLDEDAAGIPQPDIVQLGDDKASVLLATELAGQRLLLFAAEHVHLGVRGHGVNQPPYGGLHLLVVATPDIGAGGKGDPDLRLRGCFIGHMERLAARAGSILIGIAAGRVHLARQVAEPGQNADGRQLFQYVASGWHEKLLG